MCSNAPVSAWHGVEKKTMKGILQKLPAEETQDKPCCYDKGRWIMFCPAFVKGCEREWDPYARNRVPYSARTGLQYRVVKKSEGFAGTIGLMAPIIILV
mmetsp:Transcript_32019/g.38768  ORF Transcript_32019/g.38768 Transcript_32019/m.38768 type:complete len:99 (+) Transcript_32019:942-1238(+)